MSVYLFRLAETRHVRPRVSEYNHRIMPERSTPLVIGIAGGSGSGKTTVAQTILQRVGPDRISFLQHDAYYKRVFYK